MTRLLVTGATGFLGGAVAAHGFGQGCEEDFLFQVRAADEAEGLQRLLERLRSFEVPEARLRKLTPSQILPCDLRDIAAGWDDPRLHDVSHVVNCAALASFGNDPSIWEINVEATVGFAERARRWPRLQRFLQVGTGMACGVQAPSPVPEGYDVGDAAEHAVAYTASKAASEARMRAEFPDLPLVVARPSIVVGHTRLGCTPSASIFWVFRVGKALGRFLCSHEDRIDVIPVDYCAEALWTLATKPSLAFDRYHVAAGEADSCSFGAIEEAMSRALGVASVGTFTPATFREIAAMHPRFEEMFGPCNKLLLLRAIELYGRFAAMDVVFDNRRLLGEGIARPPRFTDYIEVCARTAAAGSIAEQMQVDLKWDRRPTPKAEAPLAVAV